NAPAVDHPGSSKRLIDRALLVEPMRRWRERLCSSADLIVTPTAAILPASVPANRVRVLEWGADTERFRPGASGRPPFAPMAVTTLPVVAGAFRSWHRAIPLVEAIKILRARGRTDIGAVLIGDGPERPRVMQAAGNIETIVFTGAIPHDRMPAALSAADVGVAPFDVAAHAPLALGFYWSPLKIFEYMAAGLPVVAPAVDRIPSLVENGREGILYVPPDEGSYRAAQTGGSHAEALAAALLELADPQLRQRLGAAARDRAVRQYSWAAHSRALEAAIAGALRA